MEPGFKVGRIRDCSSPVLVLEGGGAADEALSALGQVSAQNEVKLSACTADVLDSCGLCIYLTEEVEVNRVVDGHEVVQGCDGADVVGVINRSAHAGRVVV